LGVGEDECDPIFIPKEVLLMTRPNIFHYYKYELMNGKYLNDLEKYIDYLESKENAINQHKIQREIERLDDAVKDCVTRLREVRQGRG